MSTRYCSGMRCPLTSRRARLSESARLEDLESHVALNPELRAREDDEDEGSDY